MNRAVRTIAVILATAAVAASCGKVKPQSGPVFDSPGIAALEFAEAIRAGDKEKLATMLGPESAPLLNPGDTVQGGTERKSFLQAYDSVRVLVPDGPDAYILEVGGGRWPLPIPIARTDGGWKFDTTSGIQEMVLRRIGRNELAVLNVMRGIVAAQQEYSSKFGQFATKLRSEPGKQDGLYWETAAGEPASPAGPFIAWAEAQGYTPGGAQAAPYRGYFYKRLEVPDPKTQFAVIAYPAEYGASGIFTFIVNEKGEVWGKNLGVDTPKAVELIQAFAADASWRRES